MPLRRASARPFATAAVGLGLLLAAGCAGGGPGEPSSPTSAVPVESISAEIEAELGLRDDVADVDVYYQDTFTVPANATVDVTMEPGADRQAISDEAVRLVWESRLEPLSTINVSVIDPVEPVNGLASFVNLREAADREPLERAYGPRPT